MAPQRPGRVLHTEDFEGSRLPADWTWVREPDAESWSVSGGALRMDTSAGDLHVDSNSAPVLTTPAPRRGSVVQTRVRLNLPAEGPGHNVVQAGLVLYGGDDRFIKLVHASLRETRQTEFA